MAVIAASVVILTAGYILWTIQRVYLGAEYKGPHGEALTPVTRREIADCRPAFGLCHFIRRISAGIVGLHDAQPGQTGKKFDRLARAASGHNARLPAKSPGKNRL